MVLFAKITPENIEATLFAFLTGTFNFANSVLAPMAGSTINDKFVGVTSADLSNFKTLCLIGVVSSLLPFFYLRLIPLKEEIKKMQDERINKVK